MRKLAILFMTLFSISIYAQKKEAKTAEKLYKKGNYTEALSTINQACKIKDQADDKTKAKIMFVKAEILAKLGKKDMTNYEKAIKVIKKLQAFEKKIGKEKYSSDAQKLLNGQEGILTSLSNAGSEFYKNKQYAKAAKAFELIYGANGNKDLEYYAAVSSLQAKDWDKSLKLLKDLYKSGYDGVKTVYTAVNKQTGKKEKFNDSKTAKLLVSAGTYKDFKEEKSKSLRPDLIANILYVYGQKGNDNDAIKFIEDAKKEDPNNLDLIIGEGNYYLKKGDNEKFAAAMKKAVELEPNNKLYNFNLATALYQMKKYDEAKKYYQKTIDLDPSFVDAYKGLAYIVLVPEKALTDKMNTDEVLMNDRLFNKYKNQQKELYKKALPYFEKALKYAPKDEEILYALNKIYRDLEMKDKAKEIHQRLNEVKAQNKK